MPAAPAVFPPSVANRPLWLTLPGAPRRVALGWTAWIIGAVVGAPALTELLGPAGTVLVVLGTGWALGRRALVPTDCLRRCHLDDTEVTAFGPGTRVLRLPWSEIVLIAQEHGALRVETRRTHLALALGALVSSAGWSALLTRVVAGLAAEMWSLLEEGGRVRLEQRADPPIRSLLWWAYAPALMACTVGPGVRGLALGLAVVLGERALARFRRRSGAVVLDGDGMGFRRWGRRVFVPWSQAEVVRAPQGLLVGRPGGPYGLVASGLSNFWAAAPVIETKAQLGSCSAAVQFRVRVAGGTLAVVGEVEPVA